MSIETCITCRYYQQGNTWKISPIWNRTEDQKDKPFILIVDSAPNKVEDKSGRVFDSYQKCSKQFRELLAQLDSPYAIASGLGCYPIVNSVEVKKPTDKEILHCAKNVLHEWIYEHKPKVIVCLGAIAMKAVLLERAPAKLEPILNSFIKLDERDPDSPEVVVTNQPSVYFIKDEMFQKKIHLDLLAFADDICLGNVKKQVVKYIEVKTSKQCLDVIKNLNKKIYFDIENTGSKYDKKKATLYHPGTQLICFSITDIHFGEPRTWTFHGPILKNHALLRELFVGKIVTGHNVHHDIQGFYATTGIDIYEIAEDIECTFAQIYISNQNRIGNGLKALAEGVGAYDWSVTIKQRLADEKKLLSDSHAYFNRQVGAIYRQFKKGKATLEELLTYRMAMKNKIFLRPNKSQDYGNIGPDILPYNAEDTVQNWHIDKKVIQPLREAGDIDPAMYDLVKKEMRVVSYIERNGLQVDLARLRTLTKYVDEKISEYRTWFLNQPVVMEAILNSYPNILNELKNSPGRAKEILYKAISPKAKKFFEELGKLTGVMHLAVASYKKKSKAKNPTNGPCFDGQALLKMAGGLPDTEVTQRDEYWVAMEEKTEYQKLWLYFVQFRKLFDLRTRFLKDLELYSTDDGRVRSQFVLFKSDAFGGGQGKEAGGGAGTGRISSRNPNLMNLKKDKILRWVFCPGPGFSYAELDYKSIEPRVMALITGCKKFLEAFNRDLDLYQVIANEIYSLGVDLTQDDDIVRAQLKKAVSKEMRDLSKTSTLAIMYGESPRGFASRMKLPLEDVLHFFRYFNMLFPEIDDLRKSVKEQLLRGEPIVTWFGRRKIYELPSRFDDDYGKKMASILRQAFNFLVQSVANDIMLLKAYKVMLWIISHGIEFQKMVQAVNIIHDAVVIKVHDDYLWALDKIQEILSDMSDMPFKVDLAIPTDKKIGRDLSENLK